MKRFLSVLSLRRHTTAWLASSAMLVGLAVPIAAQGALNHFGLDHTPLGGAALVVTPTGGLEVSNIGSSGLDGVRVALGSSDGWDASFLPMPPVVGSTLECRAIASGPGVVQVPSYSARATCLPSGSWKLEEGVFAFATQVTLTAYHGELVVYQASGLTSSGTAVHLGDSPTAPARFTITIKIWHSTITIIVDFRFAAPTLIQIANGPAVLCDRLEVVPDNPTQVFDTLDAAEVTGTSLPPITLTDEQVVALGHSMQALGQATLAATKGPPRLVVSNIGSMGLDGVRIRPPIGGSIQNGLGVTWEQLDPTGVEPVGADVTAAATGVMNGVPDTYLGSSTITKATPWLYLTCDYSAVGSTSQLIEIYNQGNLVVSIPGHTGPIATFSSWPRGCGKRFWPRFPPLWCLWWDFAVSQQFTVLGQGAGTYVGDEIRVLAEGSPGTISSIESFDVTRRRGDVIMEDIKVATAVGQYFGTGCPGSTNLVPISEMTRLPIFGTSVPLQVHEVRPNSVGFYVLSLTRYPQGLPLAALGAPGCFQYVGLSVTVLIISNSAGVATFTQNIPSNTAFTGLTISAQAAMLDLPANPLGVITSNGMYMKIGW